MTYVLLKDGTVDFAVSADGSQCRVNPSMPLVHMVDAGPNAAVGGPTGAPWAPGRAPGPPAAPGRWRAAARASRGPCVTSPRTLEAAQLAAPGMAEWCGSNRRQFVASRSHFGSEVLSTITMHGASGDFRFKGLWD